VLDYDDLLLYWAQMVGEPALGRGSARASTTCWSTSTRTPTACRRRSCWPEARRRGLTVVGDDAQSIYAFRGADGAQHPRFPGALRSPPAQVVTLERNYRSTQPILAAANAVIALAAERFTKDLWSERSARRRSRGWSRCATRADQARYVVEQVLARREAGIR
jgi:DNA helicase-2/ATP-dependent DNA helicase PcrA